jgi:simple sugar transport system permease protein
MRSENSKAGAAGVAEERRTIVGPKTSVPEQSLVLPARAALRIVLRRPEVGAFIGMVIVFTFFAVVARDRGFLSSLGTTSYLQVAAELGILVAAVNLLMIAGEFDLSIGSMVGASGVFFAYSVVDLSIPVPIAISMTAGLAAAVGLFNGYLVVRTGLPSFIVTLGTLYLLRGVTIAVTAILTSGTIVGGVNEAVGAGMWKSLFAGTLFGLPASVFWWAGLVLVTGWILGHTTFGNWIYGTGDDARAARNLGVPVARVKMTLFVATALAASLLAMIQVLGAGSADVSRGELKEFQAVAATVIGGTLLTGGYGGAIGAGLGALLFGMVSQGIFFTGVDANWFQAVLGGMLLLAALINHYLRRAFARVG